MIIRRGYRFQLKTNGHESDRLNRFAGSCRLVWNKSLALQKEKLSRGEKFLRYFQVTAELTKWKNEQSFLKEVHSQPLQQTLKDLDQALQNSFKKTYGFPKFKKKVEHDSFRFPRGVKLAGEKIYLPKIGWLKFRKSKEVEGTIKNVTVSKKFDKWYISIQVEIEISEPVHASKTAVGINLGVVRFATLSDGTIIEPLNSFKNAQTKLIREQRKLSRQIGKNKKSKFKKYILKLPMYEETFFIKRPAR
jgi:putative transposase